jgi:aminoglycoside phosphotransferase (APT) family kinase protein
VPHIPALEAVRHADEGDWLIVENIPHPLPQERWWADPEILAVLRSLHRATFQAPHQYPGVFRPGWGSDMTDSALSLFPERTAAEVRPLLSSMQEGAAHLFAPLCSISGDPNPSNWGLREDGSLVLFDWERFGAGTPALDLAITVPGLGKEDDRRAVASAYLVGWPDAPFALDRLIPDMALAKAWTVVELLSGYAEGWVREAPVIDRLLEAFPSREGRRGWEAQPRRGDRYALRAG